MVNFKKQRYFIHKTTSRKLFKMVIDKCYFNQVKKTIFTFTHTTVLLVYALS
jgi:hypothetical protein